MEAPLEKDQPAPLAGLQQAVDAAVADIQGDLASARKYMSVTADADQLRSKAVAKLGDRKKAVAKLEQKLAELQKAGGADPETLSALATRIADAKASVKELDSINPATGSLFLRLFLGQVNVRVASKKDRDQMREEYEKFKTRTNYGFLFFPLIWIANSYYLKEAFVYTDWIYVLTHIWLLYYYISLALRENILRMNGSTMRQWWITHHYISATMSVVVLTWPSDSKTWAAFSPQFTAYFLYQGIMQLMQSRYQRARHYARVAMGRAGAMDVSHTETLSEVHAGLWLIVALALFAQAWQLYNGYTLLRVLLAYFDWSLFRPTAPVSTLLAVFASSSTTAAGATGGAWFRFKEEVQVGLLAVFFILLGCMNFTVTAQTVLAKFRPSKRAPAASRLGLTAPSGGSVSPPAPSSGSGGTASPVPVRPASTTPLKAAAVPLSAAATTSGASTPVPAKLSGSSSSASMGAGAVVSPPLQHDGADDAAAAAGDAAHQSALRRRAGKGVDAAAADSSAADGAAAAASVPGAAFR